MGAAFLALLLPFLLFFLFLVMVPGLILIFVRPDRLRPPWWDWGLNKTNPDKKNSPDEKPK